MLLRHPTPGGRGEPRPAFAGHLERLEQSAETLSSSSSDLGVEIRRLSQELKRRDSSRSSTRSVRYSSARLAMATRQRSASSLSGERGIVSPVESMRSSRSGAWSFHHVPTPQPTHEDLATRIVSPQLEGRPLDAALEVMAASPRPRQQQQPWTTNHDGPTTDGPDGSKAYEPSAYDVGNAALPPSQIEPPSRNASAASRSTLQRAGSLFRDFDGVHYYTSAPGAAQEPKEDETGRGLLEDVHEDDEEDDGADAPTQSGGYTQLATADDDVTSARDEPLEVNFGQEPAKLEPFRSTAQRWVEPPPRESMVYYPAPIPRMLNLPKRLSQQPAQALQNARRSQVLQSFPRQARQSKAWNPKDVRRTSTWLREDWGHDFEDGQSVEQAPQEKSSVENTLVAKPLVDEPTERTSPEAEPSEGEPSVENQVEGTALEVPPVTSELSNVDEPASAQDATQESRRISKRRSSAPLRNLPPQLRASVFFDHESVPHHFEIKDGSAVATLNHILNESVRAPVGDVFDDDEEESSGADGTRRRAKSITSSSVIDDMFSSVGKHGRHSMLPIRSSSADPLSHRHADGTPLLDSPDLEATEDTRLTKLDDGASSIGTGPDDDVVDGREPMYAAPNTLMAELQMRKLNLQNRNRTVARVDPNGMHSTLLQLDRVAQIEQKRRRKQRTALAWEDPSAVDEEGNTGAGQDDEEVPLGVLFPAHKGSTNSASQPMGLIQKKHLEDNEPLSRRRHRLQGIDPDELARQTALEVAKQREDERAAEAAAEDPGHEGETVAQRARRLKSRRALDDAIGDDGKGHGRNISQEFAKELMSQLGGPNASKAADARSPPAAQPREEESLGQRRRRLQADAMQAALHGGAAGSDGRRAAGLVGANERAQAARREQMRDLQIRQSSYGLAAPLVALDGGALPGLTKPIGSTSFLAGGVYNAAVAASKPRPPALPAQPQPPPQLYPALGSVPYHPAYQPALGFPQGAYAPPPAQMHFDAFSAQLSQMQLRMAHNEYLMSSAQRDNIDQWRQSVAP